MGALLPKDRNLRRIIVTGDDFGLALPVNEAIVAAHRGGILTTASLMVGAEFANDAVERARENPSLRVGLHLVLVEGRPISNPKCIPDLVDARGVLPNHLTRAGFRFFFRPGIRRQLEAEIRGQFEAFRDTGLALDHVNAHNHMHLHPTVLRLTLKIGREFGLKAVRFPNEPPFRSWRAAENSFLPRIGSRVVLSPWMGLMRRLLRQARVRFNDFIFGMTDSGKMNLGLVTRFLRRLPRGVTEIYFHPATRRCPEIANVMPNYRHEEEFRVLTSKSLLGVLEQVGTQRIAFSDL